MPSWRSSCAVACVSGQIRLKRNQEIRKAEAKKRGGCEYPGCSAPGKHWHHRDPATKLINVTRGRPGVKTLRAELKKCEYLCTQHHGVRHRELHAA